MLCATVSYNERGGHHFRFKYGDFIQPLNETEQSSLRIRVTVTVGTASGSEDVRTLTSDQLRNAYWVEFGQPRVSIKDTWTSDYVYHRFEALMNDEVVATYDYQYLEEDNDRSGQDMDEPFLYTVVPPENVSHLIPAVAVSFTFSALHAPRPSCPAHLSSSLVCLTPTGTPHLHVQCGRMTMIGKGLQLSHWGSGGCMAP